MRCVDEINAKNAIKQTFQSFLYSENKLWINDKTFDIT